MTTLLSILAADILPIFAIAGVGFLLAKRTNANVKTLSAVSFNALSPCLVFDQLVTSTITGSGFWRMVVYCAVFTLLMGVLARLAAWPLRLEGRTLSSFVLVLMFSNSGNYALPVVLFAFGNEALSYASVFFVTSATMVYTVGVMIAASGGRSIGRALRGVSRVPALYAVAAAGIVSATHATMPLALMRAVHMLSEAALPMMLLILGMQLSQRAISKQMGVVAAAVVLSLLVAPVIGIALANLIHLEGAGRQAAIVLSGMPAAVITTVLALEFDLDSAFTTNVVFVSTLLSPCTLVLIIDYLQR